mgnify:CR=1 FL=1
MSKQEHKYVSRAGVKLEAALDAFDIRVNGWTCADLGCATGGFTHCLLERGAERVYAVDTGYGIVDWNLRNDPRVTVMERTNAMHVELPEPMDLISIDTSWTRQSKVLPRAVRFLKKGGAIISLVKPHYEADKKLLERGVLPDEHIEATLLSVEKDVQANGLRVLQKIQSPIKGGKGGNTEYLFLSGGLDWNS